MSSKILISMKSYIGDAVMAQPLLNTLAITGANLTLLTSKAVHQLYPQFSGMPLQQTRSLRLMLDHVREIRRQNFDAVILTNFSLRSAVVARLAGIPVRVGHTTEGRGRLLTNSCAHDPERFFASSLLDLARLLGIASTQDQPRLFPDKSIVQRLTPKLPRAFIAVQPGARYASKRIPEKLIIAISETAIAMGFEVVFVGGSEESEFVPRRLSHSARIQDRVGKYDLAETIAAVSIARATIGADTGLMHLSAAVGTPTAQIFGPTNIAKWGHNYSPHAPLATGYSSLADVRSELVLGHCVSFLAQLLVEPD